MPNVNLLHPFDSNQKVFTNPESISLMIRLRNAFVFGQSEFVYDDPFSPPVGVREKPGVKLPFVDIVVPESEIDDAVAKLVSRDDVVAIFHHKALNRARDDYRSIHCIMVSHDAAHRLAGVEP